MTHPRLRRFNTLPTSVLRYFGMNRKVQKSQKKLDLERSIYVLCDLSH